MLLLVLIGDVTEMVIDAVKVAFIWGRKFGVQGADDKKDMMDAACPLFLFVYRNS